MFRELYDEFYGRLGRPLPGFESEQSYRPGTFSELALRGGHMFGMLGSGLKQAVVTFGSRPGAFVKSGGAWQSFDDNTNIGINDQACDPRGGIYPTGWFSYVWCKPGIGASLQSICPGGYTKDAEQEMPGAYVYRLQRFERGFIFRDSDGWTHGRAYVFFQTSPSGGTYDRAVCPSCQCSGSRCPAASAATC